MTSLDTVQKNCWEQALQKMRQDLILKPPGKIRNSKIKKSGKIKKFEDNKPEKYITKKISKIANK